MIRAVFFFFDSLKFFLTVQGSFFVAHGFSLDVALRAALVVVYV